MSNNLEASTANAGRPATYDDAYGEWKGWNRERFGTFTAAQRAMFEKDLAALPAMSIGRVLEIGFGNGAFLAYARDRGWEVAGTEAIPSLVAAASQRGFPAFAPEETDELPDEAFHLIAAFDVFEHIDLAELPRLFGLLRRKLQPSGRIIARFPNGDSPFGRPYQHGDLTHRTTIGEHRVVQLGRLSGLRLEAIRGAARPALGRNWRDMMAALAVRALETTAEPLLMRGLFPGCKFPLFAPNTLVVLRRAD